MNKPESHQTQEVDMSPEAIDRRLRNVSQLHELGMAIRKARTKDLGPVEESQENGSATQSSSCSDGQQE